MQLVVKVASTFSSSQELPICIFQAVSRLGGTLRVQCSSRLCLQKQLAELLLWSIVT